MTHTTTLELTQKQMQILEELALKRQISPDEVIQQEIERLLIYDAKVPDETIKQKARSVAGQFHSGLHDLSSRHDEYLAESYSR